MPRRTDIGPAGDAHVLLAGEPVQERVIGKHRRVFEIALRLVVNIVGTELIRPIVLKRFIERAQVRLIRIALAGATGMTVVAAMKTRPNGNHFAAEGAGVRCEAQA